MSKREWGAFAAIVAVVATAQIWYHRHAQVEGHGQEAAAMIEPPGSSTVTLAVSGMT
ncbi:MAG: hypothetical protein ACE5PT_07020 [Gemmatimonadales bacterium]